MAGDKVVGGSSHLTKEKLHKEDTHNENLNVEDEFTEPIEYVPCPEFNFSTITCCFCNGYYGPCFEEPVCPTCHAFLFPNDIGFYQFHFSQKSDDEDSGNDEPTELYYNHERRASQQQLHHGINTSSPKKYGSCIAKCAAFTQRPF